jgi:hypothetical protein
MAISRFIFCQNVIIYMVTKSKLTYSANFTLPIFKHLSEYAFKYSLDFISHPHLLHFKYIASKKFSFQRRIHPIIR